MKSVVLGKVDFDIRVLGLDARFLLVETCHPCVVIRVSGVEAGGERSRASAFEMECADV